ncbi:unnamed protein product [Cunninghamella echinulata]
MEGEYSTSNSPDHLVKNVNPITCMISADSLEPEPNTQSEGASDTESHQDILNNYVSFEEDNTLTADCHSARLDDLLETNPEKYSRRYSFFGDSIQDPYKLKENVDRYTYYEPSTGSIKSTSLKELLSKTVYPEETVSTLLLKSKCWWIDVLTPTDQEMRIISKIFGIHPLTTEDIQAQEAREKCEIFQNYMFVSFRSFNNDYSSQDYLEACNFYIVVFKEGVLTFRFQPLPHPHNVRKRIHQLRDFINITPEWINYALIDNITDSFAPLIQHTELEVDSIDDLVLVLNGSEQTDMLRRIGSCRKIVMQLLRLLGPKADVVRSLMKRYEDKTKEIEILNRRRQRTAANHSHSNIDLSENKSNHEIVLFLGDIQDHIQTMLQNVSHFDLVLGRAHRNYLGQISIELSQSGNSTNEVINRLTFLATTVIPLNVVAGIFGMNVHVPGQDIKDLTWFFWIVCSMILYVVAMIAFGKHARFL